MSTERLGRRGPRPRLVAGLVAALVAGASAVLVSPAPASAASGACSPSSAGVTVVVDFASLGGGVVVACAAGTPTNGLAALQANFAVAGTQNYGLAFVCRIDGEPTAATEQCVNTPPTEAHWSYWHSQPGGSWTFTSLGASSYHPKAGSVDGWAFGAGGAPSMPPPPLIPDPPPPPPPAPPATSTRANQPTPGSAGTTTDAEVGNTAMSGTTTTFATTTAPRGSAPSTPIAQAPASSRGFPVGVVAGGALVVVLAGVAAFIAWRRRHRPG